MIILSIIYTPVALRQQDRSDFCTRRFNFQTGTINTSNIWWCLSVSVNNMFVFSSGRSTALAECVCVGNLSHLAAAVNQWANGATTVWSFVNKHKHRMCGRNRRYPGRNTDQHVLYISLRIRKSAFYEKKCTNWLKNAFEVFILKH